MKTRHQILLLLCFLSSNILLAQEGYLAIRTGYSNTTLTSNSTSDISLSPRHTWHASFVYSQILKDSRFGFSIEPGYMIKGTSIDVDTMDYKFHFISTPVLFDWYPIKNLRINIGPEVAFLVDAKNIKNDSTKVSLNDTYDNSLEISGIIGASYSLSFFADLGIRYNRSFTPLVSSDPALKREDLFSEYFQVFLLLKIAN